MATFITDLIEDYRDLMDNKGDQRTKTWFMMSGPFPTLFASLFYIIFATKIGPALMKNRKAFELKYVLIIYNAIQVVVSAWLFYQVSAYGWFNNYNFSCQPIDFSDDPDVVWIVHVSWWYYMSKFSEFLDTFFFVLRKKNRQITTLHVIHHSIMPVSVWVGLKFFPGGQSTFFGFLNTFVHIIMYSYYLLAALGPRIQPYLWWKRYLTQLQLVQFVLVIIHSVQTLFIECDIPKGLMYYIIAHGVMFLVLFTNFYYKSYLNKRKKTNVPTTINGIDGNKKKNYNKESNTTTEEGLRYRAVS